jgi:alpha-methylacyl-CoA racemase
MQQTREAGVRAGPLRGLKVVELAGIGPGPFATMLLADLGADVVRVDRIGPGSPLAGDPRADLLNRGKRSIAADLKQPAGRELVLALAERADAFVEAYRPGVAERLGVGPEVVLARNPRLVYGRMTGWGQDGPLAASAGHDITYLALTGALHAIGRSGGPPQVPANLLGDFGGGGVFLALGALAALLHARTTGEGQVVDAAIVDGTAVLTTMLHGMLSTGGWTDRRGANLLDTGAPFYDVYRCADGRFVAVGALEEPFYDALLTGLGLAEDPSLPDRTDPAGWPALRARFTDVFASRTQGQWWQVFGGTDACVAPVWSLAEAPDDAHNRAREVFTEVDGVVQPAVAPRFSRTPGTVGAVPRVGEHDAEIRAELGL